MNHWATERLGDLGANGRAFAMGPFGSRIKTENFRESGVPVIRGGNLVNNRFNDSSVVFLDESKATELSASVAKPGDLIFTHRGTLGQVAIVPRNAKYGRYIVSQSQMKATLNEQRVLPEFAYYWFCSPDGQSALLRNTSQTGVPAISQPLTSLRSVEIPIPSIIEQSRIVEVLSALDDAIDANDRLAEGCDQLASAELSRLLQTSEEDGSSVMTRLGDVADVNRRTVKPSTGMLTYLDISSVSVGKAEPPTRMAWADAPSRARRGVASGDVLWSTVRPNRQSHCLLLDPPADLVVSTGFAVLSPRTVGPSFLYGVSERQEFVDYLVSVAHGSAYPAVRADRFSDAPIQLPAKAALDSYESSTFVLRERGAAARKESNILFRIREVLLRNLFSGTLAVSDVESLMGEAV